MSEENIQKSFPWTTVGYFGSFEEADKERAVLLKETNKLQAKVKRCGQGGEKFMIKTRIDPKYVPKSEKKKKHNKQNKKK